MISRIIAWYFFTFFRTIRAFNRCSFYAVQKVLKYVDVILQKCVISSNKVAVTSNFPSDQQPTLLEPVFYNIDKSNKKVPEVISEKNFQTKEHVSKTSTGKKLNKETERQQSCIKDNGNSSLTRSGNCISKIQILPETIFFSDSDKRIPYNLKDAKRVTLSCKVPNNNTEMNLFTCVEKDILKPTNVVPKESRRFDKKEEFEISDTGFFSDKIDSNTEALISKSFFSDLSKYLSNQHTEYSKNEMETNSGELSSNLVSLKNLNFPGFPQSTTLLTSKHSNLISRPDIDVSTSDPSISVKFSVNNLSKTESCSGFTNKDCVRESVGFTTTTHSSEEIKNFNEMGSFPSAALGPAQHSQIRLLFQKNSTNPPTYQPSAASYISMMQKTFPCPHSSSGRKCHICDDLVNKMKTLSSSASGENHSSRSSEMNSNLKDCNEECPRTVTEKSLVTSDKKMEGKQADNAFSLCEAGHTENRIKSSKRSEIAVSENSNYFGKNSSSNLPNYTSGCIASAESKIKYNSKNPDTSNKESAESLETMHNPSTVLNQGTTDSNSVCLSTGIENLKDTLPSKQSEEQIKLIYALKQLVSWITDLEHKHSKMLETVKQLNENASFADINDWNALHSSLITELHPGIPKTESTRTEVTKDCAEKLIQEESTNQLNKSVQTPKEICKTDDKQIKILDTLEKDPENIKSDLKEVKITENERIVPDFPRTKKFKQETYIAGKKPCLSSEESHSSNTNGKEGDSLTTDVYEKKINYSKSSNNLGNESSFSSGVEDNDSVCLEKVQSNTRPSVIYLKDDLPLQPRKDQTTNSEVNTPNSNNSHQDATCNDENLACSLTQTKANSVSDGDLSHISQVRLAAKTALDRWHLNEQVSGNGDNTSNKADKEFLKSLKSSKLSNEKSCPSSHNLDQRYLNPEANENPRNKKSKNRKKNSKKN